MARLSSIDLTKQAVLYIKFTRKKKYYIETDNSNEKCIFIKKINTLTNHPQRVGHNMLYKEI